MGGLAGVIQFRGDPPDREVVERMSDRLRARGPDGFGTFAEGPVAFAHRRKEIVPNRSVQPLVSDDRVLMLDGWIIDHLDLARRFGWDDPLVPDTAVLLEAWRRYGPDAVQHIEGTFAFSVWDRRNRTLHLVRDRMGTRPLYWTRVGGAFAFASDIPALLQVPWVSRRLARENVAEYLSFRVVHAPRTLVEDVHQLEAAHVLSVNADEMKTRRYWAPQYAPAGTRRPYDEGELVSQLQDAVEHAVDWRLQPGIPTALYLSGGLGSTAIASSARRLGRPLPSWTMGFADDPNPETPFAGRVAKLLGLDHHELVVGSANLAAAFDPGVQALGHPVGNPAVFLQLLLARAVGRESRIVLSGDGGEELFGGRMLDNIARWLRTSERFAKIPFPARKALAGLLRRSERGRRIAAPLDRWGLELGLGGSDLLSVAERTTLLADPALVRPDIRRQVLGPFYENLDTDPVNAVLNAFMRSWLQEESLVRANRTAAAAGLDVRFPLLDMEVFRMAASLSGAAKLRRVGGSLHTRWPMRAMLDGVLPPPLVHRPKRGMPMPLDPWLAGPGRLFMDERFARVEADRSGLWSAEALMQLKREVGKKPGAGLRAWAILILDAWTTQVLHGG